MSGKGQGKLKLSGNGNECEPLPWERPRVQPAAAAAVALVVVGARQREGVLAVLRDVRRLGAAQLGQQVLVLLVDVVRDAALAGAPVVPAAPRGSGGRLRVNQGTAQLAASRVKRGGTGREK